MTAFSALFTIILWVRHKIQGGAAAPQHPSIPGSQGPGAPSLSPRYALMPPYWNQPPRLVSSYFYKNIKNKKKYLGKSVTVRTKSGTEVTAS